MRPVFHVQQLAGVYRTGATVTARVTRCATDGEAGVELWVEPHTFRVVRARWEAYRGERVQAPPAEVGALVGLTAYFGCARSFTEALGGFPPAVTGLFLDAVAALIQAETYLVAERGYPSLEAYAAHWQEAYRGTCRYYSHLEDVRRGWSEHAATRRAGENLFNRFKTLALDETEAGFLLRASLSDSFHEMAFLLRLDTAGGEVREATGAVIRAPDRVCREAAGYLTGLTGVRLRGAPRRELAAALGGGEGCVHLVDLAAEAAALLDRANAVRTADRPDDGGR
ncbi:MAG: DUF2889 domain-containing protein [Bacillota bacterium]